jgi:hypothetical protein
MKLENGLKFQHIMSQTVYTLIEDYDGSWYLKNRSEYGLRKTLSVSANEMYKLLEIAFIKVE